VNALIYFARIQDSKVPKKRKSIKSNIKKYPLFKN